MTMPNSPITDAITAAFARFDATPRDLPQDAEELQKRIHFNPHLHPRDQRGRFAPKPGGKPHGDKLQPRGAKTKSKRFSSSRAAFAHALAHTQDTGESTYVIQRRKSTKDHGPEWEVTPDKPKDTPIEVSYHKKPKDDTAAPKAGGGRTLGSGPSDWGYQDGDRVKVVGKPPSSASGHGDVLGWTGRKDIFRVKLDNGDTVDLPMEHLKPASKPKSVSREERVSAYREQLRSSGMPSWAREAAVSQFREDLKLDEKLRADVDKQVERTPNVSDGGFGYKRYDSVRFDNGRGLGEQRGMVVGAENDFSEPAIMVIDSEGNTQHVYPNEQKSTIGPMYAPNGFPWGDVSFDQVGKSITGVFEAACAELDRARAGILKDQMMTGDVPTSTDGPASEKKKKKKKKGPGDCGPDGAHVAKGGRIEVGGYMRRTKSGKLIHVKGYTRDQIAGFSDEMLESKARDQKNWTATRVSPADAEKYGLKSIPHKNLATRRAERAKNRPPFTGDKPPNLKPTRAVNARGDKSTPKFKIENVDPKKGPTDEQKKRHGAEMHGFKLPKGVTDESKNPDFKPDSSGMVEGDPDGPSDGPFELLDVGAKNPSDEIDIIEDYGADVREKINALAASHKGVRGVADGKNGSVVVWTGDGVFRIST
jgi:uncharacterized protein YjhX (UPF0386 family)